MAVDFAAGCLGGCAGVLIGHPFDTIKVHLQTKTLVYSNTVDCCYKLVRKQGVKSLYKGIASPLLGVSAINAVVFTVHSITHRQFSNTNDLRTHFIAGSVAGFTQTALTNPIELVKLNIQTSTTKIKPWKCLQQIYRRDKLSGFYKGLNMTILRDVPAFGLYFTSYEYLLRQSKHEIPPSTGKLLMAGGLAGVVSWLITYPIDVIKTRLQLDKGRRYDSALDCLAKSLREDGPGVLYKGLMPTLIRAFPAAVSAEFRDSLAMEFLCSELYISLAKFMLWM